MQKRFDTTHPVYTLVRQIPPGKVLTYGLVAKACSISNPRYVGYILHHNPNSELIPCHRVVSAAGECASNFAFGLATAQEQLLSHEGVTFINGKVNLAKHLYILP